jgi:mersacidin/lichenicidin family type 2 lantibiotic
MVRRAWTDESYRQSLPADVRERIPAAPEGASSMTDAELEAAAGSGTPLAIAGAAAAGIGAGAASAIGGEIVQEVGERTWDSDGSA